MTHSTSDDSLHDRSESKPHSPLTLSSRNWGLLLGGAVLLAGGTWGMVQFIRPVPSLTVAATPAIAVETHLIQAQPMANTIELSGTLRPIERATLSTRVTGRITQLSLEEGDRFHKGEVLALIDVMDMRAQTSQAESGVAQAQAEVARSQAALSQLESQKLEAQAALRLAQINQTRMVQLEAEGAIPTSQLDEANTALDETTARVAQTQAGIKQAQAAIAQARAAVNRARSNVTSASVSERYGTVLAPFDGVVGQKFVYEGEMAAPGTALLAVENPNRLQLEIAVPEEHLQAVQPGQSVQVRVDAVNQRFDATISQIVPTADPSSRSFLIKIPLPHADRVISGMFGRIALPLGEITDTVFIPTEALIQRGQLEGVYVADTTAEQPVAVLRWVKTGKSKDGQIEIVSGLMNGDRIITSNLAQLSDGQVIEVMQ